MLDSRDFIIKTFQAEGVLKEADLRRATDHVAKAGGDVLNALVALGIVTARRLAIAKAKISEYPFVDLAHFDIDIRNTKLIPRGIAERLTAFPLFLLDGMATVAMLDPLNLQAIDQIRQLLKADVDPEDRYYNEWLVLSEFLSSIPGVLAYDPMLGEWLGQSASGPG